MIDINAYMKKTGYFTGLAICICLLSFPAQGAHSENASSSENSLPAQFAFTLFQDSLEPGFFSMQYTVQHTYEPFSRHRFPAHIQSTNLPLHFTGAVTAAPLERQYGGLEPDTVVIQPESAAPTDEKPLPRIESFLQLFDKEKNPFSSNKILLIRDAPFLRTYVSIYIYIYTDFDEIDTLESLKNIGMIVPKLNLTMRMAI